MPKPIYQIICLVAFAAALPAQGSQNLDLTTDTQIALEAGWTVVEHNGEPSGTPPGLRVNDAGAATLLLTATPANASRPVLMSVYQFNCRSLGPTLQEGATVAEFETEKLMGAVFAQGYTPQGIRVTRSTRGAELVMLTLRLNAKNPKGEERVFLTAVLARKYGSLRLSSSYPAGDADSAREIEAMAQSMVQGDSTNSPDTNTVAGAGTYSGAAPANSNAGAPSAQRVPNAATAPITTASLVTQFNDALVIVEGKKGVGSGFVCKMGGQAFIVTNAHLLSDNTGVKFTALNRSVLAPGVSGIAVGADVLRLAVNNPAKSFELLENFETTVKIGDPVAVLGNAEGTQVVRPIEGHIVGIGPNLVEVDAPFVPGNSGSPIIHLGTGRVIAIATYLTQRRGITDNGDTRVQTRRFGFRLDSIKRWETINWTWFLNQAAQVTKIEALSGDFLKMQDDARKGSGFFLTARYQDPALNKAIFNCADTIRRRGVMSAANRQELFKGLFRELRVTSRNDIVSFDSANSYDYFRRKVEEQSKFRDEIYRTFTEVLNRPNF